VRAEPLVTEPTLDLDDDEGTPRITSATPNSLAHSAIGGRLTAIGDEPVGVIRSAYDWHSLQIDFYNHELPMKLSGIAPMAPRRSSRRMLPELVGVAPPLGSAQHRARRI